MAMNKRTKVATESLTFLAILLGIFALLNVAGVWAYGRVDMTEANLFSLSEGSKRVAGDLDDRMQVLVYFTEDLPPPFNRHERYVRDLLAEYEAASSSADGEMEVKVIHPEDEDEKEAAKEDGAQPMSHQVIENDSVSVVEGFRSIVIKYLGDKKVITVGQDTTGLEYDITMAMKELTGDKRPVGILKGHKGPTLSKGLSKLRGALPTYELKMVDAKQEIDSELAALLVVDPKTELSQKELQQIDKYVMEGGSLGVFGGGVEVNLKGRMGPSASPNNTKINDLLSSWGMQVNNKLVADSQCSRAPMQTNMGLRVAVPYPPVPVINFDEAQQEHPLLFRLKTVRLPFASKVGMTDTGDDEVNVATLARTSKESWLLDGSSVSLTPKRPNEWQIPAGGFSGPHPVMAAVEGKLPSAFAQSGAMSSTEGGEAAKPLGPSRAKKDVRVFVSGSGMLLQDQFLPPQNQGGQRQLTGALALALNAVDWLAAESDLIAIRAKNIEPPALDVPEEVGQAREKQKMAKQKAQQAMKKQDKQGVEKAVDEYKEAEEKEETAGEAWERKKALFRWGHTLGIPLLVALFGIIRWQMRARKKQQIKL